MGLASDRSYSCPNNYYSTLVRDKCKFFLFDDGSGAFFQLLKTVSFKSTTFADLVEEDVTDCMACLHRKFAAVYQILRPTNTRWT